MRKPKPQPQDSDDGLPWGVISGIVLAIALWLALHTQISYLVMYVRYAESFLMIFDPEGKEMLAQWFATVHPSDAKLSQLIQSGSVAGYTLRWFALAIMVPMFVWLYIKAARRSGASNTVHTMKSLAEQEQQVYPTLKPVIGLDLENVPLDDPINGMRMDARMYCRRHQLILPRYTDQKLEPGDAEVLADGRYFLKRKASAVIGKQLGRAWEGVEHLKPFERTLFAAFIAQIHFVEENALTLRILNGVASNWKLAAEKRDPSLLTTPEVEATIAKYGNSKEVSKLVRRHSHVRCVLRRLLEQARENGKLPAAWMRWVKMIDRTTWYVLNDLGLYVASVEACGVHAHYMAEKAAKGPIAVPMVEPAVDGVIEALNTFEDPEEDDE